MPISLTIVCNLERLAALDIFDSAANLIKLGFGLNLSPGAEGAAKLQELRQFVSPWTWNITSVQVQWSTNPPAAGEIIDQRPPALRELFTQLEKDLDDYETRLGELAVPGSKLTTAADKSPQSAKTACWTPRLLHLATYPFPIPQTLNLSRIFRIDITKLKSDVKPADYFKIPVTDAAGRKKWIADNLPGQVLAAAPVLGATGPFSDPRSPDDTGVQNQRWAYKLPAATAPSVTAFVDPISVVPPADKFVDMTSQWITHPTTSVRFAENWQAYLEVRMAEAFRLPELFVEYLRSHANDPANGGLNASNGLAAAIADIGVALIADCAGFGLVGASSAKGNSFAERLFATVDKVALPLSGFALTQAKLAELETLSHNVYNLGAWKQRLSKSVPSLGGCELLTLQPRAMTVAEIAAQFQRILDQVFATQHQDKQNDQINLWILFQDQWADLLTKATLLTPAEKGSIKQALASHASPPAAMGQPSPPPPRPRLFDLRARLAQDNIDRFWRFFTISNTSGDADGLNLIEICFPAFLNYYALLRFGLTRQPVAGCSLPAGGQETDLRNSFTLPCPQVPAVLRQDIAAALDQRATTFKDFLRPKPDQVVVDERVPQGLTFSLGRVDSDTAANLQKASDDILEKISGSVVLMREVRPAAPLPWQCLNYAETWLQTKVLREEPAVVPYKVHYRGNVKQALVTYNNRSITADSPLSERDLIGTYVAGGDQLDYRQAFLRFRYCGANAYANPKDNRPVPAFTATPGLKFGKSYQFAAFALTNCGIPPREVAGSVPWQVATNLPATTNIPPEAIVGNATGLKYLRGVKVGPLRIKPVIANDQNDPRVIPPDVSPRAREYDHFDDGTPSPPQSAQVPLVLLAPASFRFGEAGTKFAFDVRPPATGWECWDRWLAFDSSIATPRQRSDAIAEIYRLTSLNWGISDPADVTVDDPAVHTQFRIELQRVQDNGKLTPIDAQWFDFGAPGSYPLKAFQRTPRRVTCTIAPADGLSSANGEIQVHVKEGELYRLALYPAVPKGVVERFVGGKTTNADPSFFLRAPSYFAIEVATALPAAKSPEADNLRDLLWKASSCVYHIQPNSDGKTDGKEAIRVDFNPFKAVDPGNGPDVTEAAKPFRYFHRAVATHQAWRWTGRPVTQHPALKDTPPGTDDLAKWEAREFGDRLPIESIPHPMAVLPRPDITKITDIRTYRFEITPRDSKGRYDERGQHHRFRIEAWSRYEGLLTPEQNPSLVATLRVGSDSNEWQSLFVPSRFPDVLPAPRVKLILPLTQSEPEDRLLSENLGSLHNLEDLEKKHRTAGLLVVLNEPWYEKCGLGEEIEARIDLAPSPANKADTRPEDRRYFRQAGPDPTVNIEQFRTTNRLLTQPVLDGDQSARFDPKAIVGPVGHYFDADNTSALFVATSFILPPPTLPAVDGVTDITTPWYMSRVAFRRKLTTLNPPAVLAKTSPPDYPDASWQRNTRYSLYTEPLWVQYLPEFSLYDGFSDQHVSALHLDTGQSDLRLKDKSGSIKVLKPTLSDNRIFALYLVLTRMVADVIGRPDQETYVATFQQDSAGTWTTVNNGEKFVRIDGAYRARIIEVQTPKLGPITADGCWKRPSDYFWDQFFFTDEPRCDAPARITRISEPIDQNPRGY